MADSNVIIRLSLKDGEQTVRGLQDVGDKGERALRRIETASRAPSAGMRALAAASDETRTVLDGLGSRAGAVGTALSALGAGGLVAAAGIGAAVAGLAALHTQVRTALDRLGEVTDMAERLGLSAESLQSLSYGLEQGGVSAEQATSAFTKLADAVGTVLQEGADAPKETAAAFSALGISMEDVQRSGGDLDKLLPQIADGMQGLGSHAERVAVAKQLLGREGAKLVPILQQGSGAIEEMRRKAAEAGAVLSNEFVKAADDAGDAIAGFERVTETSLTHLFGQFDGLAVRWAEAKAEFVKGLDEIVSALRQDLGGTVFDDVAEQLIMLNAPGGPLISVWNSLEALVKRWRDARAEMNGATGSWQFGAEGSWEAPAAPAPARPALPPLPEKKKSGGSSKRSEAERDYDAAKRGYDSYLKDQMREERQALADLARGERELVSLRIEAAEATGLHARALELRRQAALKAIRDEALSETELQEAIKLTNSIYDARLAEMKDNGATLNSSLSKTVELTDDLGRGFEFFGQTAASSFADAILQGEKLSDTLAALGNDLARMTAGMLMQRAIGGALSAGGNWLSGLFSGGGFSFEGGTVGGFSTSGSAAGSSGFFGMGEFRQGGAFDRGQVLPFAKGGVVDRPVLFPLAKGAGLMGEAGPEAIMPLTRLPGGNLGVRAAGAAMPAVNFTSTVINNVPGVEVRREERQNDSGGMDITYTIDRAMADLLTRRGSASNRALRRGGDDRGPMR